MFLDVGLTRVRRHSSTSQPEALVAEAFLASKSHDLRRRIGNVGPVYTEATSLGCDTAVTAVEIAAFFLPDVWLDGEMLRGAEAEPESLLHESCAATTGSVDLVASVELVAKASAHPAVLAVPADGGLKLVGKL